MRALAQLFFFLGSLPGLSILSRIGSNLSRLSSVSDRAIAAKRTISPKKNDTNKENSEESKNWLALAAVFFIKFSIVRSNHWFL